MSCDEVVNFIIKLTVDLMVRPLNLILKISINFIVKSNVLPNDRIHKTHTHTHTQTFYNLSKSLCPL